MFASAPAARKAAKTGAFFALFPLRRPYLLVRTFQTQTLGLAFGVAQFLLLYVWTSHGRHQLLTVLIAPLEFVLLFAPIMLNNMAIFFSVGPLADAASVAEAMTPPDDRARRPTRSNRLVQVEEPSPMV